MGHLGRGGGPWDGKIYYFILVLYRALFFRFTCDVCKKAYVEERHLHRHFKAKHSTTLNHEDLATTPSISTLSGGRIFLKLGMEMEFKVKETL